MKIKENKQDDVPVVAAWWRNVLLTVTGFEQRSNPLHFI